MSSDSLVRSSAQASDAPAEGSDSSRSAHDRCLDYIEQYWERIIRTQPEDSGTLIGVPYRYPVANHEMFQEQYYWDTYFIMLAFQGPSRGEVIVEATSNLLYLFKRFHRIPNASRFYMLSRSQPPFLSSLVMMSYEVLKATDPERALAWLREGQPVVEEEYRKVWRGRAFPDLREVHEGLSRYYDLNIWHNAAEAESGWDMTPRFYDRCLDFLPVDLNALLFKYEMDFAEIAAPSGDEAAAARWRAEAEHRRERMSALMWDDATGFFYDYDFVHGARSTFRSLAGFFPLWSGCATQEQARAIVEQQLPFFETPYGLITSEEWHPSPGMVPRQWAWPNGWAPLHWIAIAGLERYGFHDDARRIAQKWLSLVASVFEENGVNYEKYDVVRGRRAISDRYHDQEGFGWTNGVYARLARFLKEGKL